MPSFVYRQQAIDYARKQGYVGFRTVADDGMWKAQYTDKEPSPAADMEAHDWVHHTEIEWVDGVRVGVLVVNITLDELHLEHGNVSGPHGDPPFYQFTPGMTPGLPTYRLEPFTPSLWEPDPPQGTKGNLPSGGGHAGPRERSSAESPVKTVWRIADEMAGQPRKDVIAACVAAGVNKATANTQFYHWSKAKQT